MIHAACSICGTSLKERPRLQLDGRVFCYCCAKQVVAAEDRLLTRKLETERKAYEQAQRIYCVWCARLNDALPGSGFKFFCIFAGAFLLGSIGRKATPIAIMFGAIIGYSFSVFYTASRRRKWVDANPPPPIPNEPSGRLASHRIELLGGGTTGREISGDYRLRILERDDYTCQNCRVRFAADMLEVHHIKPKAKRGKDFMTNLITLCLRCHESETWFGHFHYRLSRSYRNYKP